MIMKNNSFYFVLLLCFNVLCSQTKIVDKTVEIERIVNRIQLPVFPKYKVAVTQFGAKGDSITNCKSAFDKAMKACDKKKGGTIVVPKGVYTINGPIHFVSNVNLHLEA